MAGGERTTIETAGDPLPAYLATADPGLEGRPATIVVQEYWGLVPHIEDVCRRLAAEGITAVAPDLYRGRLAEEPDEARKLSMELDRDRAVEDLRAVVGWLLDRGASSVGAVGFCMGGGFVLLLAAQQDGRVSAAVPYYGVGSAIPSTYEGLTAAVQGHYGERDDFYPADDARAQAEQIRRESGAEVEFHFYDAGHAFHNDTNALGTYSEGDARLAWSRTVDFLRAKVV
jgi:carboxymethylenebutenolidase